MTRTGNTWRYIEEQPAEYLKHVEYAGFWWTDSLHPIQIQLTRAGVQYLKPFYQQAVDAHKPFTFFISDDVRAKWRKIDSRHGEDFYISQYGENLWTAYDPNKINHLATNSVSSYYRWDCLPESLKAFIEFPEVTP